MTRILLTRHGETLWNQERRLQGFMESELSPKGVRQAICLAKRLSDTSFSVIFTSPTGRSVETAALIRGEREISVVTMPLLREMDLGPWQGELIADLSKKWPEENKLFWDAPERFEPLEGGESFADLVERADRALAEIISTIGTGTVLAVSHSLFIKAAWRVASGLGPTHMWSWPEVQPCSVTELKWSGRHLEAIALADASHLDLT